MRHTRRAFLSSAALGSLAMATGCSGGSSDAGGGPDELSVWTFKQSEVKAMQTLGDAWGKQNNASVKVSVFTPDAAFNTKIQSAAKSKTLPDVICLHSGGEDWQMAQAGITVDLTDDFTSEWQASMQPGIMSALELTQERIDNSGDDPTTTLKNLQPGKLYGVPMLAGTPGVVFANKKLLAAAGVDTSAPPADWESWVTAIGKTHAVSADTGGLVTGLQVPETGYYWVYRPMAYAYLGKEAFYGRQGRSRTPSWDSTESLKTLSYYDELSKLWAPGVLALGIDQADQSFASGKAAWDVGGTFTLSSLTTFGMSADDVMVFPVPAVKGGQIEKLSYQASPLISATITSTTTKHDQALSFIKYITSVDGAKIFATESLDLPATKLPASAVTDPLLKQLVGLIATDPENAFNPNDFSADPAGKIGNQTAVTLARFPAKKGSVDQIGSSLADQYRAAWASVK